MLNDMNEKTLGSILCVLRRIPAIPGKSVQWGPVKLVKFSQSRLPRRVLALCGKHNDRPPRGAKLPCDFRVRIFVRLHRELSLLDLYQTRSPFGNKNSDAKRLRFGVMQAMVITLADTSKLKRLQTCNQAKQLSFYLGLFILREIPRFFYSRTCPSSVSQRRGFALPAIRRFLSACGGPL